MAISFASQIQALTGFESKSSGNTDSETGDDFDELAAQWMNDAAKEVMNILPPALLSRCSHISAADSNLTGAGAVYETKITGALRSISTGFNDGEVYVCRLISHLQSFKAADPNLIEYATETDPVYYIEPQASPNALKVRILPTSSANVAKVIHLDYPAFVTSGGQEYDITTISTIHNFPDEAEYLVVIRAAIFAGQYLLAIEQDEDLYEPIIEGLEKRYKQGIDALQTKKIDAAPTKSKVPGKGGMDISKLLQGLKGKK